MRYWNAHRKSCQHVGPVEDWRGPVESWIEWLDAMGRADQTLRTRYYQIAQFSRGVGKPIAEVTEDDLIFFLADLGREGRRGMRAAVKMFYRWCVKHGLADHNPADDVPAVPMGVPTGLICPEREIEQGLLSPDENARLAVMLGAFLGLRRAEMTCINLDGDLDHVDGGLLLHVHGKGSKERVLPVPERIANELDKRDGPWLFPGDVHGHCGVDFVGNRIKRATGYPSHSLRRRFATVAYYRNGCNIVLVSRMLGHANIATTMRYIGLVQDEMRNAVESTVATDLPVTLRANHFVGAGGEAGRVLASYSLDSVRIG